MQRVSTSSSLPSRLRDFAVNGNPLIEAALVGGAIAILLVSTLPHLGNYPAITDDEMWVFSSAYRLAHDGVFGTSMFEGFYGAESHYYFNMPLHHVMIAASFKLFGYGIVQARLVGVVYGVAILVLTYLLARRISGVPAAILSLGLLLFLRLAMGFDTGLALQELSTSMRYDLAPLPFVLAGLLVLLGGPSLKRSMLAGLLFGLAILMQFYGAFAFPIAMAFIWLERLPARERLKLIGGMLGVAALVGVPYGAYILSDYTDFKGQVGTIDKRDNFLAPSFYVNNILNEPERFLRPLGIRDVPRGTFEDTEGPQFLSPGEMLTRRPSAKLAVIVGLPLSLVYLTKRYLDTRRRSDLLLPLTLGGLVAQFALLESAKFYIYWIMVMPFLCISLAVFLLWLLQPPRWQGLRLAGAGAAALALLIFFGEGTVARIGGIRTAPNASSYSELSAAIHEYVPPGSKVIGSTSLWWAMKDTDYRSYFLFFYLTRPDAGPYKMTISEFLQEFQPDYIVLTKLANDELGGRLIPSDNKEFRSYLEENSTLIKNFNGPIANRGYSYVDIWEFR